MLRTFCTDLAINIKLSSRDVRYRDIRNFGKTLQNIFCLVGLLEINPDVSNKRIAQFFVVKSQG